MSEQSFVILKVEFESEEIKLFTSIGLCNSKKGQVFYTLSGNDNLGFMAHTHCTGPGQGQGTG